MSLFLLICHFAVVLSVTILCGILFLRTRDGDLRGFLTLLVPLFVHAFTSLWYHLFLDDLAALFPEAASALPLFMLVLTSIAIPFLVFGTSQHLLGLLDLPEQRRRGAQWTVRLYSLLFLVFGLFFIVYLNGSDWTTGLSRALNEYFLYGSLYLVVPAIVSTVHLRRSSSPENQRLLRQLMISFYPIPVLAVADLLVFVRSPYKLSYISYFLFILLAYLYITRRYVIRYEPPHSDVPRNLDRFCAHYNLSEREREVVPMLIKGTSNRDIAEALFISTNTVKTHVRNIYGKTGASNRLQLMFKIRHHPER